MSSAWRNGPKRLALLPYVAVLSMRAGRGEPSSTGHYPQVVARVTIPVEQFAAGRYPPVCAKTGGTTQSMSRVDATSAARWTSWMLIAGFFAYALARSHSEQERKVEGFVPLHPSVHERLVWLLRAKRVLGWLAIVFLPLGVVLAGRAPDRSVGAVIALPIAAGTCAVLYLVLALIGWVRAPGVDLSQDRQWVTLKGVHPEFAAAVVAMTAEEIRSTRRS